VQLDTDNKIAATWLLLSDFIMLPTLFFFSSQASFFYSIGAFRCLRCLASDFLAGEILACARFWLPNFISSTLFSLHKVKNQTAKASTYFASKGSNTSCQQGKQYVIISNQLEKVKSEAVSQRRPK
jgi:hypothetical protein